MVLHNLILGSNCKMERRRGSPNLPATKTRRKVALKLHGELCIAVAESGGSHKRQHTPPASNQRGTVGSRVPSRIQKYSETKAKGSSSSTSTRSCVLQAATVGDTQTDSRELRQNKPATSRKDCRLGTKRSATDDDHCDYRRNKRVKLPFNSQLDSRKRRNYDCSSNEDGIDHRGGVKRRKMDSFASKPIGYKRLEEICHESDPDEVVLQLTAELESKRLESLLQSDDIRVDLITLLIQTLSKVQASTCFSNANSILNLAWQKNGGFLISHLSPFISAIPEHLSRFQNVSNLLLQICDVLSAMLSRFERMIVHQVSPVILQLKETIDALLHNGHIQGSEVNQRLENLLTLRDAVVNDGRKEAGLMGKVVPPDDFRVLEVTPQVSDFHCYKKPFLRVNIVDGAYEDLDHYLDVQFRLLREDFVIPLRECIKEKINSTIQPTEFEAINAEHSGSQRKTGSEKHRQIYHEVMVLNPVCSKKKMVYRIRFDVHHPSIRHVRWEKAFKRLKFGSLVCLSSDNFETLHFATVENRDGLQVGELEVRFEDDNVGDVNKFIEEKETFDMVESPTFYEAYRHVLKSLQNLNHDNLPFQDYIVHCQKDIRPPAYLTRAVADGGTPAYNLTEVSSNEFIRAELASGQSSLIRNQDKDTDIKQVPVLARNEWPSAQALGLNESQLRAFQVALTKEFAVIQGPPGTGKTYVGLKIARALLDNRKVWQEGGKSPILMVSYTNHALDQFVEGLLHVKGVVRVGGRCKSEKVQEFSLRNVRMQMRQQMRNAPLPEVRTISRARSRRMKELRNLKQSAGLEEAAQLLRISRKCIFSLKILKTFINKKHFGYFELGRTPRRDLKLLQWLRIEKKDDKKDNRGGFQQDPYKTEDYRRHFTVRFFADDEYNDLDEEESHLATACTLEQAKNSYALKRRLVETESADEAFERRIHTIGSCPLRQRWMLYRLWRQRLENYYRNRLQENQEKYEEILVDLQEVLDKEDEYILSEAKVIAMTTTCAARYSSMLQRIRPKIIIAEEAAEVLEAHIITALNPGCQHLILIGDHQQLRPNPNVYELAHRFKLDVSLFERMVHVGLDCVRLSVQHRMRPEISALMRHIYTDLEDHESVTHYDNVTGMKSNLFFLNHQEPEHESEDSHSHYNQHEAEFLVALSRYLLQQGYEPNRVTMLTTYTGQMFAIRDCLRSYQDDSLNELRVTTVDNFQGEENDIVLLSLVRSNDRDKAGFIKVTNRACVALSRAKKGFYCIGNFHLLSKNSEIWHKIVEDLRSHEFIGDRLSLLCPRHNDTVTEVTCAEDFVSKVQFGGCREPCLARLPCGHTCTKNCHADDRDHRKFMCEKDCIRRIKGCLYDHRCPKLCFEKCPKKCIESVHKTLPCQHTQKVKCCEDQSSVKCKSPCEKVLVCDHRCQAHCGEPCTTKCNEFVKRRDWTCGHETTIACSATQEDCKAPCGATLECEHKCSGTCGECRQGRVHKTCKFKCGRPLVCSHVCRDWCSGPCPPCSQHCENSCFHNRCDKICGEECMPCNEKCQWKCRHLSCDRLCSELCKRPPCNKPCNKVMACRHRCRGLCNEDCVCAHCDTNGSREPITSIFLGGEDEENARFIRLKDCRHIFAVSDMDRYMTMETGGAEEDRLGDEIQLKCCPRCKTPIRRSCRYGNVIKRALRDIAKVKEKLRGSSKDRKHRKTNLLTQVSELKEKFPVDECRFGHQWQSLEKRAKGASDNKSLATMENQAMLTQRCCELTAKVEEEVLAKDKTDPDRKIRVECLFIMSELEYMVKRITSSRISQRELKDVNTELTRLSLYVELSRLQADVNVFKVQLEHSHHVTISDIRVVLESRKLVKVQDLEKYREQLAVVRRAYAVLSPLTSDEKRQIVEAVALGKGHWFKCPQGHVYAIGECGGAMQRSRCPECNADIGGERHTLVEGNALAPEMDGARYAAWTEQANMQNYVLD